MIGKNLSHYKILDELGRGGMGIVYKAEDTKLDRTVAIKVLSRHLDSDSAAKKRFIHEAKTASSLDHPNVGYIHEIGETEDGQLYIAMAFYSGEPIEDKIARGPIPVEDALDYAIQTAEGLKRAHAIDIIHRDIKPGNLMVTDQGVVKIVDFGVSKMASQTLLTKTGSSIGTTLYMSPEQARGDVTDHRVDIWALGVALYEMLAGVRPFKSEYESALVYSILNEDPEFITKIRPETPVALERVIEKALAKKVDRRFQTIDEMLAALREVEVDLRSGQAKTKALGLGRRQQQMLIRVIAGVVFVILALALYRWGSDTDPVSIAVLPLRLETPDTTQIYFVNGVHESLSNDFVRISGWRVRGRSSVMQFQDASTPIPEIARILSVDYVFDGRIRRDGDRISISATLIDALTDTPIWFEEYQGDFSDIRILLAQITREVASQAGVELTPNEHQRFASAKPVNAEAQDAYYLGRYHWGKFTRYDLNESLRWFELAREADPEYALVYAGIAESWVGLLQMGFLSPAEASSKIVEAAEMALELDSTLAGVHHLLAVMKAWVEWNWEAAGHHFQNAIAANPSLADSRAYYSHYLIQVGRNDEGMEQAERAFELEPTSALVQSVTGWSLLMVRRLDEAAERFQSLLKVQPNNLIALDGLWDTLNQKHEFSEALANARLLYAAMDEPSVITALDEGFEENGYPGAMLRAAQMLAGRADSVYSPAYDVARLYLNAGRNSDALDWLERGVDELSPDMPYIVQPLWDPLRDELRFKAVLTQLNLPE
ncbi:MAG: protein kinase [Bacteroidetes bacterium]|nr:protein kinase [Bacteroidota bacterium]